MTVKLRVRILSLWLILASVGGGLVACGGASVGWQGQPAQKAGAPPAVSAPARWTDALWQWAGRVALAGANPQAAIRLFQQAKTPSTASILLLGDAYWQSGDTLHALQMWQFAQSNGAPPTDLFPRLAKAQRALGDFPAATASLRQWLTADPLNASAAFELALLLAAVDPAAAPTYFSLAAELDPAVRPAAVEINRRIQSALAADEPAYGRVLIGRALAELPAWDLAAECFRQAAALRPDYSDAWAFWAEAQENNGGDGLAALQQALDLDPQSPLANTLMAFYWQRRGDDAQALDFLNQAIASDPQNPALYIALGHAQARLGELEQAAQTVQAAVALAPTQPVYWQALAEFSLQYELQLHSLALPAARQAVLLDPSSPQALDLLGQTLFRLGDLHSAARFFARALQLDASFAPAHLHLGQWALATGDLVAARGHFEQAAALDPESIAARQASLYLQQYFSP